MRYHILLIMKHYWRMQSNKRPYFLLVDFTTRKLRCKQPIPQPSPISDLPLEILYIILSKLPPRTLGRLKVVCKAWRDAINSPSFVLHLHLPLSRKTRPFIVSFTGSDVSCVSIEDNTGICNELLVLNRSREHLVLSTCNGLLCCAEGKYEYTLAKYAEDECSLYVINPVTGEKIQLPSVSCHSSEIDMCQLIWDEEIGPWGVYKLLLIYERETVDLTHTLMFTLGVDRAWRSINNPYKYWKQHGRHLEHPCIGGAIHRVYDNSLVLGDCYKDSAVGVCVNRDGEEPLQFVAAFDIKAEKFREIAFPDECHPLDKPGADLFVGANSANVIELRGLLCFLYFNISQKALDVWLLTDYGGGKWIKDHSVFLDFLCLEFYTCIDVLSHLTDERVLMHVIQTDRTGEDHFAVASYNPKLGTAEKVKLKDDMGVAFQSNYIRGGVFTESLVPLSDFMSAETRA